LTQGRGVLPNAAFLELKKMETKKKRGGARPGAGPKIRHPSGRGVDVHFYLPPALAKKVRAYVAQLRAELDN
jgi:hypothetical protein